MRSWLVALVLTGCAVGQDPPLVPPEVADFERTGEVRFQAVSIACTEASCAVVSERHPNAEASFYAMLGLALFLLVVPPSAGWRFGRERKLLVESLVICTLLALPLVAWAGAKLWVVRRTELGEGRMRVRIETLWSSSMEERSLEGAEVRLGYVRTGSRGSPKRIHFLRVGEITVFQAYGTDEDEPAYRALRDALAARLELAVDPEIDWAYLGW